MNHYPQPGVYLFVGGPWDGLRRQINNPLDRMYVNGFPVMPATVHAADAVPTAEKYEKHLYKLESLYAPDEKFWLYLDNNLEPADLIRALIKGYKSNDVQTAADN